MESIEYLNDTEFKEFLTSDMRVLVSNNMQAAKRMRVRSEEAIDTVYSLSEIPSVKEVETVNTIYDTGIMETSITDLTKEEEDVLNSMTEIPLKPEERIKRTEIKNGKITSYNADGVVLFTNNYEDPDMSDLVDTLEYYANIESQEPAVQQIKPINALSKARRQFVGANVVQLGDGNILVEENIAVDNISSKYNLMKVSGELKSLTTFKCYYRHESWSKNNKPTCSTFKSSRNG